MTDFEKLRDEITRENALVLLQEVACGHCGTVGAFMLFDEPNNGGVGIQCVECEKRHPIYPSMRPRILWLRSGDKRRANDIEAVIKERGGYCYSCGLTREELRELGIGMHVHHTRPFSDHGERYCKIPLCMPCHEIINALQRTMQRFLKKGWAGDAA